MPSLKPVSITICVSPRELYTTNVYQTCHHHRLFARVEENLDFSKFCVILYHCVVRYYICFWFSNNSHLYVFPFCLYFQVKNEGRALFLNAVCMKCLDGKDADRKLCCRFCAVQWDGSSLIMGTMYAYDVFAAMPCCNERLKVCTFQ